MYAQLVITLRVGHASSAAVSVGKTYAAIVNLSAKLAFRFCAPVAAPAAAKAPNDSD